MYAMNGEELTESVAGMGAHMIPLPTVEIWLDQELNTTTTYLSSAAHNTQPEIMYQVPVFYGWSRSVCF